MAGNITLSVTLQGTSAALAAGRISLSPFTKAFNELFVAYRDIASGIVTLATESYAGRGRGRRPRFAERLEIQIDSITHSSPAVIALVCPVPEVPRGEGNDLFAEDVVRRTADELVSAVEAEAKGTPRNKNIRNFLANLPEGTTAQTWRLFVDGALARELSIGELSLVADPDLADTGFVRVIGRIVGVHFPPATPEVRILSGTETYTFKACDAQVNTALEYRDVEVEGLGIQSAGQVKLLWLRTSGSRSARRADSDRDKYFTQRWEDVLKRLAR